MKLKKICAILAAAVLCLGVSACSPKADSSTAETAQEETQAKEQTETTQTEEATEESTELEAADLNIFIAASLKNSMEEIQKVYSEKQPNINILYNPDSSGTLQKQIEEGATCDIFFSAAQKQMNALNDEELIEKDSIVNLLENQVVLIKPKDGETKVTGFENITEAKNIALAGEDVPVGAYSREIFESMGITDKVMSMEINEGANVTAVLAAVSEGSNEIGIVYATDASSVKDSVDVIASAPEGSLKSPVVYPVGIVINEEATDAQKAAAKDFITFLQSDDAIKVFSDYGFKKYE